MSVEEGVEYLLINLFRMKMIFSLSSGVSVGVTAF